MNFGEAEVTKALELLNIKPKSNLEFSKENIMCHCPYHQDRNPSFGIRRDNGIWMCKSCKRTGNLHTLARDLAGVSILKLLDIKYDEFVHHTIFEESKVTNYDTYNDHVKIEEIIEDEGSLDDPMVSDFLSWRVIKMDQLKAMNARFIRKGTFNEIRAYNRIAIPIVEKGKTISYELRDYKENSTLKVIYPKRSSVDTFYDIDSLDKSLPLYIVESLIDLPILREIPEFRNSTCLFGSSINENQAYLLQSFPKIILIPDNDDAGNSCIEMMKKVKKSFELLRVPSSINSIKVKDVGEIHTKAKIHISELVRRKWIESKIKISA